MEKKQYYIVKRSSPPHGDEPYICVPAAWVCDVVDGLAVVRYPRGPLHELLRRLEAGCPSDTRSDDWLTLIAQIVQTHGNYRFAVNYTKRLNSLNQTRRSVDKVNELTTSDSDSSKATLNHQCDRGNQNDTYLEAPLTCDVQEIQQTNKPQSIIVEAPNEELSDCSTPMTTSLSHLPKDEQPTTSSTRRTRCSKQIVPYYVEDSSDDDFEERVKFKKIIRNTYANDYNYRPELTNKPLKLKIFRKPNETEKNLQRTARSVNKVMLKSKSTSGDNFDKAFKELRNLLTNQTHDSSKQIVKEDDLNMHIQDNSHNNTHFDSIKRSAVNREEIKLTSCNDPPENTRESLSSNEFINVNQKQPHINVEHSQIVSEILSDVTPSIEIITMDVNKKNAGKIEKGIKKAAGKKKTADKIKIPHRKRNKSKSDKNICSNQNVEQNETSVSYTSPIDYRTYDSSWTFKYTENNGNLVELEEGTGVYVDGSILDTNKTFSKDINQYALMLLLEVFTMEALIKCSWTADPWKSNYTVWLDKKGTNTLLNAVENHAREKGWAQLNTFYEIESFKEDITKFLWRKMLSFRKKIY
ncbi:uncharacterized protein LOC112049911 [Bicyclus anynana]|uniref:Uncharacterized protein LOC112049911 n=1 Tax=Bicyclus anynana TaxID=110368 RepID=A0A6J1NFI6_BICAN|nr:uncharacterized protein LOC112049911 [Bicyclus anynana]XP_023943743.1 uncharacterized protein LOC112049911 [Bicyclus anynana]